MSLPRELWIIILEIKWWTARKERLEKVLKFPKSSHWCDYIIFALYEFNVGENIIEIHTPLEPRAYYVFQYYYLSLNSYKLFSLYEEQINEFIN